MSRSATALNRRALMSATAGAGALLAATQLLRSAPATPAAGQALTPPSRSAGGYRLTEHVKQYYRTALV
jgi:hypothetical protein